jgi:hypothetical protein
MFGLADSFSPRRSGFSRSSSYLQREVTRIPRFGQAFFGVFRLFGTAKSSRRCNQAATRRWQGPEVVILAGAITKSDWGSWRI